jgi:hypothetical protein
VDEHALICDDVEQVDRVAAIDIAKASAIPERASAWASLRSPGTGRPVADTSRCQHR